MSGTWINDNSYLSGSGGLFMGFGLDTDYLVPTTTFRPISSGGEDTHMLSGNEIASWGKDNLQPLHLLKLLSESNINPQLLWTKVDFAAGERIFTYKEDLKQDPTTGELVIHKIPVKYPKIESFFKHIKVNKLMRARATDYYFSGNVFSRLVLARNPDKYGIAHIDHVDNLMARAQAQNKTSRKIENFFICSDWLNPIYDPKQPIKGNTRKYKAFNENDPLKYFRTIQHSKIYWPGQIYYGIQPWHSAANWIGFANKIPVWMDSNIKNSYNIKYHIEYPDNYFDYTKGWPDDKRKAERERVFDEMDKWLAGQKNTGKAFYSRRMRNPLDNKEYSEWKISPIKNDIKDDAFLNAYKASNSAMTSGWGIDPSLASIQRDGKFASSGSEMRISYQLHIALKVQAARSIMVEPLEIVRDVNGWDPEVKFGFINKNVVTLAESKGGMTGNMNQIGDGTL